LVQGQQLGDEVLGLLGHRRPNGVSERELAALDFLHDFLIAGSVEWRDTGKGNVRDNATGPNVAFWAVIFGEYLGRDVIGCSEFLVQFLVLVKHEGGSKVDDFNLIKLLVLLQKDVFRLQIPVDDVIGVAVIDARQNLFHEN